MKQERLISEVMAQVRRLRRTKKLRQEDLAAKAGLSREACLRAESGGSDPRLSSVEAIAGALGYKLILVPLSAESELSSGGPNNAVSDNA